MQMVRRPVWNKNGLRVFQALSFLAALPRRAITTTVNPLPALAHANVLSTIGKTPLIKLNRMAPRDDVDIWVKCEQFNPMSSVKDRLALGLIEWAEEAGKLMPGQVCVRLVSGEHARA